MNFTGELIMNNRKLVYFTVLSFLFSQTVLGMDWNVPGYAIVKPIILRMNRRRIAKGIDHVPANIAGGITFLVSLLSAQTSPFAAVVAGLSSYGAHHLFYYFFPPLDEDSLPLIKSGHPVATTSLASREELLPTLGTFQQTVNTPTAPSTNDAESELYFLLSDSESDHDPEV